MPEQVMVIGGSGHARVIIDAILSCGDQVVGILDDGIPAGTRVLGVPVLGKVTDYIRFSEYRYVIAIGNNDVRRHIAEKLDVEWYTLIHPTAYVSRFAQVGEGSVIMAHAAVNAGAVVGRHCIVNTGAIVEHDNRVNDFAHLSPSAALSGAVTVGECTHIGIGAVVRNNITITDNCVIGAGAVVVKDIMESGTYVGIPARKLK